MSIYLIIYACEDIKCINKYVYIYVYIYKQIGNYISVNIQINIIKIKHMNETLYISENNVWNDIEHMGQRRNLKKMFIRFCTK